MECRGSEVAGWWWVYSLRCPGAALTASCPLPLFPHLQDFGSLRSVTSRCDLKANLVRNGCGGEFESPVSSTQVLRSLPLSSKGSSPAGSDVIQMTPQEVTVNLRPGEWVPLGWTCSRWWKDEPDQGGGSGEVWPRPQEAESKAFVDDRSIFAILKNCKICVMYNLPF